MPEFYKGTACKYQRLAQPYLDAIAHGFKDSDDVRNFLLEGTPHENSYNISLPLWGKQWEKRDPKDKMKCPFWSNYWYDPCENCSCRIDGSVSMEVDALFFVENASKRKLAIHIEMKRPNEKLSIGQAEAYRPRAACFRDIGRPRKSLLSHHDFITVLFCGSDTDLSVANPHFDRIIVHEDAARFIQNYPA